MILWTLIIHLRNFLNHYTGRNVPPCLLIEIPFLISSNSSVKTLTEEVKVDLDKDITVEELLQAIKSINSGKTPGPYGLPIEFYKTFQKQLLTPLLDMFNESFNSGTLPPTLRLATIILILKPGKIPTDCSSYRPISLMEVDTKLLCKVLTKRLDPHIPLLVHGDQNGFVQTRQGFHNIRRVLNIIHSKNNTRDTALLSLDARQAFNRIEWHYLFNLLPGYGLGGEISEMDRIIIHQYYSTRNDK